MHNKPQWGLLRVCATCQTPRLNLNFELRHSWNNIPDKLPTGTALDTTLGYLRCRTTYLSNLKTVRYGIPTL